MTQDVTIYIGRFSPFHAGHAHVLKHALETSKLVILLIGSSGQARSLKNPFTFDERCDMIQAWQASTGIGFDDNGLTKLRIMPIRDYPYNDAQWIRNVQRTVKRTLTKFCIQTNQLLTNIAITGSDRDGSTWYLKSFPQWKLSLQPAFKVDGAREISATDVRHWLFAVGNAQEREALDHVPAALPASTRSFLMRFSNTPECEQLKREWAFVSAYKRSWEAAPYAPTFVTVDAVVVQSGHLLVVKRGAEPGKGLWALPGGFLDQNERLRDGAIRELVEETGIRLAEGKNAAKITAEILKGSIRDKGVFDKPDRSSRGRTITTAFLFRLDDTKPLPKVKGMDDAVDAFWIPINDALEQTSNWFEDHHSLVEWAIGVLGDRA